ncbi:glycosyltransferase family 4 protein [Nitrospiraceae bacterium HYJII51-Mn-bac16s-1-B09]|uniref:Glycosyltransferase family 4 protein n=2 Tax=Candidatus Manganitrophus noduliformans TaxID=2606439 RepID=A0A7X6DUQ4_9BACT|nr:glycosyltransferase family 4 protein [Candidatus Manganitrophus noduliformans]
MRDRTMKRLKVAHVINSIGLGGVPAAVYHLLEALPPERYELSLYTLKRYSDHADVREEVAERFRRLGIPIFSPDRDEKKFQVVAQLCEWILRDRIDLLHTHSYKPNLYGRLAGVLCRERGVRIVAHYHNQYDDKWERDGSLIYDRLLDRFSDRLIACSESVREHLVQRVGLPWERIDVILNGADLSRFQPREDAQRVKGEMGLPLDRPIVAVVGRISEQKGQDDFIYAAKTILRQVPETLFLVIGAADEAERLVQLQRLAQELGIEKEIIFTGYIADMSKIYPLINVLVVPSRWEGFGLVLVEAMAAGRAIVATRVGAIPEVVVAGETARLVPPGSPAAIASEVVSLLQNPERARKMGERGIARAADFSWKRAGMELDRIYEDLRRGDAG